MSKSSYARKKPGKRKSGKSKAKLGSKYNISKGSPSQLPDHVKKYMISMKQLVGKGILKDKLRVQRRKENSKMRIRSFLSIDAKGDSLEYWEFDINNRMPNNIRDAERFLIDSKGHVYYTSNHYASFVKVK
ncbi:ribonuclease domain-containing protein [Lactiplantibacillus plantarum]|uniref:ribonuclease domain-containing protein n=1 Tax=Lactiplantibacillus plantarum TaxID=1590 RepID=UPI0030F3C422